MSGQASTPSHSSPSQPAQGSLQDMVLRMQTLLGERIDRTREKLRFTEEAVSKLETYEAKIASLEAELKEVRRNAKEQEIRARKLEADNAALRAQIPPLKATIVELEDAKKMEEGRVSRLRETVQHLHQVATLEIGRTARALLPSVKGGLRKKEVPLTEKAEMLVAAGVVDPAWYLERHPDVAAAGMEAAVHYVLHGAEEGRVAKPALDEAVAMGA